MIREAIISKLAADGVNRRQFCIKYGFNYPNFVNFLKGGNTLSTQKIEEILVILKLKIVPENEDNKRQSEGDTPESVQA